MLRTLFRTVVVLVLIVGVGYGIFQLNRSFATQQDSGNTALKYAVHRRTIDDRVIERGTIESQNTVSGKCELPGWSNKIISIVDEGTVVKKGDLVAQLEAEEIDQRIAQEKVALNEAKGKLAQAEKEVEIQKNKGESDIAKAALEFQLAELDLEKYELGDSKAELADQERSIKEAEAMLEKVRDERNNTAVLVKKGYRSPEQLREIELREQSFKFQVESERQKLKVLKDFDYKRKITEFKANAENFKLALARARTTATAEALKTEASVSNATNGVTLHQEKLKELEGIKEKCKLIAPQDGTVAYANQPWFDPEERIREGTTVRQQQGIFYLPDMENLQVRVNVHESVVNRIKLKQKASIRLDAFSEVKLVGTVSFVSELAASSRSAAKNYEALVIIEDIPEGLALKPGMTAAVDILVGTYEDIIAVPIGAITEHFQQTYAYVLDGNQAEHRRIKTGRMTHSFVEVIDGLTQGEIVALDAYQRGTADFADAEREAVGVPAEKGPGGVEAGATGG